VKKYIVFVLALAFMVNLKAQDTETTGNEVMKRMAEQIKAAPQEKVYLHIDKPYYSAGERVWYRIYMVHAAIHAPMIMSRYVYVELLNAHDEVILRKKIRPTVEGVFFGQITLSTDLAQGWYSLRAYTNYMRNIDENYFYRQKIYIGNSLKGLNGVNIDENSGSYNSDFKNIAKKEPDFDVQFFPEGGHLITGNMQMVGFKAISKNGLGTDISGRIMDEQNKEISTFKSTHLGMGAIPLTPQTGKSYHAICTDSHGQILSFNLPEVSAQHYALAIKQSATVINIGILTPNAAPRTDTLFVVCGLRGLPVFQSIILPEAPSLSVSKNGMLSGVTQIMLLNKKGEILSERLIYVSGKDKANLNLTLDKPNYLKRDDVHASLLLKDSQGKPVQGNFSISVTDDNDVKIDSSETTIESYLLLKSDLKGFIEKPNDYFKPNNKNAAYFLDMLMLTQGWKRYDATATIAGDYMRAITYLPEQNPTISGKVQNFPARRGIPKATVSVVAHKDMRFDAVQADNYGRFVYQCADFPDSTSFLVQAEKKPGAYVEIVVNKDTFPKVNVSCIYPDDLKQDVAMKGFLKKSRDRYYYQNGMMSVTLNNVVVTAKKVDKSVKIREDRGSLYSNPSYTFDEESISKATSLKNLLMQAPGVTISGDGRSISMRNATPVILVDNMEYSMEDLNNINPNDVSLIDILKDPSETAMLGSRAANGAICIYLKRGEEREKEPQELGRNQAVVFPLGYDLPSWFYVPKYQIEENREDPIPDLRSTIYWNPCIKSNANGEADLYFYTADSKGTYTIIAEGVTPEGEIIRYQGKLNRK